MGIKLNRRMRLRLYILWLSLVPTRYKRFRVRGASRYRAICLSFDRREA